MMTRLIRWWQRRHRRPSAPPREMAAEDAEIIRRYAAGATGLREQAISIHRRYIPILGVRGSPEQRFMAEVDSSAPDLGLRVAYRKAILNCP